MIHSLEANFPSLLKNNSDAHLPTDVHELDDIRNNAEQILSQQFSIDPRTLSVKGKEPESADQNFLYNHMVRFVRSVDAQVNHAIETGNFNTPLFRIEKSPNEVALMHERYADSIADITLHNPDSKRIQVACPMSGGAAFLLAMHERSVPTEKLHPVYLSASNGTESGHTKLDKKMTDSVMHPDTLLHVVEDIMDRGDTLYEIVFQRLQAKGLLHDSSFTNMRKANRELTDKWTPFEDSRYQDINDATPEWMHASKVIFSSFGSKNEPKRLAIERYALLVLSQTPHDSWAHGQLQAARSMNPLDQHTWVTGAGNGVVGLYDMGHPIEAVVENEHFPKELREILNACDMDNKRPLRLLAETKAMLAFDYKDEHKKIFADAVAGSFSSYLRAHTS